MNLNLVSLLLAMANMDPHSHHHNHNTMGEVEMINDSAISIPMEHDHGAMQTWENYIGIPISVIAIVSVVFILYKHFKKEAFINSAKNIVVSDELSLQQVIAEYLKVNIDNNDIKNIINSIDDWLKAGNQIPTEKIKYLRSLLEEIKDIPEVHEIWEKSLLWETVFPVEK